MGGRLLDQRRVTTITQGTINLTAEHAALVEGRVLPKAPSQTAAQLQAAIKKAIIAVDPDGAEQRHEDARKGRRVALNPEEDGMASRWALLPAPDAIAAFEWLTRFARGCGADDPRTMDERRADLAAELLSGRLRNPDLDLPTPVNPGKPLVQVLMPMTALFGLTDDPCELLGYGPITASMAREIAENAVWRRLLFDPESGALLDHGRTTYTPPVALADFVKARDVYCRFPTCRRKVVNGELDHVRAYADGGSTSDTNLAGYCTRHHHLKHAGGGWQVRALPDGDRAHARHPPLRLSQRLRTTLSAPFGRDQRASEHGDPQYSHLIGTTGHVGYGSQADHIDQLFPTAPAPRTGTGT
jgi:hypothetical protein